MFKLLRIIAARLVVQVKIVSYFYHVKFLSCGILLTSGKNTLLCCFFLVSFFTIKWFLRILFIRQTNERRFCCQYELQYAAQLKHVKDVRILIWYTPQVLSFTLKLFRIEAWLIIQVKNCLVHLSYKMLVLLKSSYIRTNYTLYCGVVFVSIVFSFRFNGFPDYYIFDEQKTNVFVLSI